MSTTDEEELRRNENGLLGNNMLICGPAGCGKTSCVIKLLHDNNNEFARMYVVADQDEPLWERFESKTKEHKDSIHFYETFTELNEKTHIKASKQNPAVLIIDNFENRVWPRSFEKLLPYLDNKHISCIIVTQKAQIKSLPNVLKEKCIIHNFYELMTIPICSASK
jgi:septin family protein